MMNEERGNQVQWCIAGGEGGGGGERGGMQERMAMVPTMTPHFRARFTYLKLGGVIDRKEGICCTAMPVHCEHNSVVLNGM